MRYRRTTRLAHGFTLIEAVIATMIIGIGVSALFVSLKAGTEVNGASADLTQAVFLANEIREWTLKLPFSDPDEADADNPPGPDGTNPLTFVDDLDDMMDVTYSPPRDATGAAISELTDWSQRISMTWRNPDDVSQTVTNGASDVIQVQVEVLCGTEVLTTTRWLVTRR